MERIRLAERVSLARDKKVPWRDISRQEEVPERTLQHVHRTYLAELMALKDPDLMFTETAFLLSAAMDVLCREMEEGDTSSARVGAARAVMAAVRDRLNLFASVGALPGNIGARVQYRDSREKLDQIVLLLRRHCDDIPEHVLYQVNALMHGEPEDGSLPVERVPESEKRRY